MSKIASYLCVLVVCSASLPAQEMSKASSAGSSTTQTAKIVSPSDTTPPPIINVLTVIGEDVPGVPCLDCLLGILVPTLGLPVPLGKAYRGSKYQIDSYLIDNSYTGPCTFTFQVRDSNNVVLAIAHQTLNEQAGSEILLTTPVEIPTSAGVGLGTVSTTAVCGSSTTRSQSHVFIACVTNPPYCVD